MESERVMGMRPCRNSRIACDKNLLALLQPFANFLSKSTASLISDYKVYTSIETAISVSLQCQSIPGPIYNIQNELNLMSQLGAVHPYRIQIWFFPANWQQAHSSTAVDFAITF